MMFVDILTFQELELKIDFFNFEGHLESQK